MTKKTIKSRYGDERYLDKISDTEYIIWGESHYMRSAEGMIDFEGGPCIFIGEKIEGRSIIKIEPHMKDNDLPNCYKLTVEK